MQSLHPFFTSKEEKPIAQYQPIPGKRPEKKDNELVNEKVRFPEVLLIGPNGEQLGKMPSKDAYYRATAFGLDLVCVAPNATPPVCKVLDYGKYRFEAQKKARENRRNQNAHIIELKEIQLSPVIGEHDLLTKVKHATKFLKEGNRVKVGVRFRGRQLAHPEVGKEVLDRFIEHVIEFCKIEKEPYMEGKWLIATLSSKFKK